jgi:hypothetical protein
MIAGAGFWRKPAVHNRNHPGFAGDSKRYGSVVVMTQQEKRLNFF